MSHSLDAPIINITKKFLIIHAPMGRKVQLSCPSMANPPATLSWEIPTALQIYSHNTGQYLEITTTNEHDYGNYTCTATNGLGEDKASFKLEEVGELFY